MFVALSSHAVARASETVLLFETPGLRPGMCAALRLQLADLADVSCRADRAHQALPERIDHAARTVVQERARLGVLLERDRDPRIVRMMLVSAPTDQAVMALERIHDRRSPDVDRSLALKVRDTLEVVSATEAALAQQAGRAPDDQAATPRPDPTAPAARASLATILVPGRLRSGRAASTGSPARWGVLLEAGAALSAAEQLRAAAALALGARRTDQLRFGELALTAQAASRVRVRVAEGEVSEDEWSLSLSMRAGRAFGALALGALGEVGVARVSALGVPTEGRPEQVQVALPRLALGLDLRLLLVRGLALRLAPALELYPIEQRFGFDRQVDLALGRLRVLVPLTLLVELAFARDGRRDAH